MHARITGEYEGGANYDGNGQISSVKSSGYPKGASSPFPMPLRLVDDCLRPAVQRPDQAHVGRHAAVCLRRGRDQGRMDVFIHNVRGPLVARV